MRVRVRVCARRVMIDFKASRARTRDAGVAQPAPGLALRVYLLIDARVTMRAARARTRAARVAQPVLGLALRVSRVAMLETTNLAR